MSENGANNRCQRGEDIATYLDGEMSGDELTIFENHVRTCKICADELQTQKRLLNELDFAFGSHEESLPLPKDFTKVVKATAESNMSGLRQKEEKTRALRLCTVLIVLSAILLGWARLSDSIFVPVKNFVWVVSSFLEIVWRIIYDAGLSVVVIIRAVSRHFVFESNPLNYFLLMVFFASVFWLSRLILRSRRT